MSDLQLISDGAILIHNGIIQEVGSARRIENLASARLAREVDAGNRIVMPAFADADLAIASPRTSQGQAGLDIRRMSGRRLDASARAIADELVRYGVLTVGAPTSFAPDLQSALKALRIQRELHAKPLRIRSIYSPPQPCGDDVAGQLLKIGQTWMPSVARKKLASIIEVAASEVDTGSARLLAAAAATTGCAIRIFADGPAVPRVLELASSSGAVALVGLIPATCPAPRALLDTGCVNVIPASQFVNDGSACARGLIDDGVPIAFGSGYRSRETASFNPQYVLHLAGRLLGMTPEEAIVAATYNAVCSLRLSHVTGSLEPGKSADLCIMDVGDYHDLGRRAGHHDVSLVMRAGKFVWRRSNPVVE